MTDLYQAPVRTAEVLLPDPGRVITRTYMPGGETDDAEPRTARLVRWVLGLSAHEVERELARVRTGFADRHRDLDGTLAENFARVADRNGGIDDVAEAAQLLIGAYATMEFSTQAAALFNPSMVTAPGQAGVGPGERRFVMSVRSVGEGHLSCVEFRTGLLGADGEVAIDPPSRWATTGTMGATRYDRDMFRTKLDELGADPGMSDRLMAELPPRFDNRGLERGITDLAASGFSPAVRYKTVELARMLAASNYVVAFPEQVPLSERVLFPIGPTESQGMEDARFVRFTHHDGAVTYYATYTAFDGVSILPQLIETGDFTSFRMATLNGPSARNKGMALFPRTVGGSYVALSRYDQENIDLMVSDEVSHWEHREQLHTPTRPWEMVQLGNCGSPLETEAGWLVLTHGVGHMRTYSIGALLLDLDDPHRVIGALDDPLLVPDDTEREGYVPNVVYSCGGMIHGSRLVLPYGFSDSGIRVALADLDVLLNRLAG